MVRLGKYSFTYTSYFGLGLVFWTAQVQSNVICINDYDSRQTQQFGLTDSLSLSLFLAGTPWVAGSLTSTSSTTAPPWTPGQLGWAPCTATRSSSSSAGRSTLRLATRRPKSTWAETSWPTGPTLPGPGTKWRSFGSDPTRPGLVETWKTSSLFSRLSLMQEPGN